MTHEEMIAAAVRKGFSAAAVIDTEKIVFDPSFRPYCEENLCGQYGVNYACPPDCGTPEQMKQKILAHKHALVLESMCQIQDMEDNAALKQGKRTHNTASVALMKEFRAAGIPGFLVGSGGCSLCSPCKLKTGEPCAFPEYRFSCMSAYCIFVKKLADLCEMEYVCPPGLITFYGMYVFD